MSSTDSSSFSSSPQDYVVFFDLWGLSARKMEAQADGVATGPEPELSQRHFVSVLCELAERSPQVRIEQVGDVAYLFSSDLNEALAFACAAFKRMTLSLDQKSFDLRSLRAGVAQGVSLLAQGDSSHRALNASLGTPSSAPANVRLTPQLGRGLVEAAKLEKSCQRGMRLFLTKELGPVVEAGGQFSVRMNNTKGFEHWEMNWMMPERFSETYFERSIEGRPLRDILIERSRALIETPENSAQQLGAALNDLLRWADKTREHLERAKAREVYQRASQT